MLPGCSTALRRNAEGGYVNQRYLGENLSGAIPDNDRTGRLRVVARKLTSNSFAISNRGLLSGMGFRPFVQDRTAIDELQLIRIRLHSVLLYEAGARMSLSHRRPEV
jgi:hypothetical protein